MDDTGNDTVLIRIDELGRTNILDEEIFRFIAGAGDLSSISDNERCNNGCGSNMACFNVKC